VEPGAQSPGFFWLKGMATWLARGKRSFASKASANKKGCDEAAFLVSKDACLAIENVHRDFETIPQVGRFGFAPGHDRSPLVVSNVLRDTSSLVGVGVNTEKSWNRRS
jgi:hypothetical protein